MYLPAHHHSLHTCSNAPIRAMFTLRARAFNASGLPPAVAVIQIAPICHKALTIII